MKPGKKTKRWLADKEGLKLEYLEKGLVDCEMRLPGCMSDFGLGFAHRHKRGDPRCEHTFKKTCLACAYCHEKTEYDRELNEEVFTRLRG